jgi:hypothetical protein
MPDPKLMWIPPLAFGSGKLATLCARMHWEYLSALSKFFWALAPLGSVVAVPPAATLDEVLARFATPADGEVVPHPAKRRPAQTRTTATRLRLGCALNPLDWAPTIGSLL